MDAKMRPLAWSLLVVAGAFVWAVAKGQDLAAYLPGIPGYQATLVPPRPHPLYDPPGLRAGDFILHPHLDEGIAYDSNVFGATPSQGSWILGTHPSLQLGTDWKRDSFGAYLGIDNWQYLSTQAQSRTDWTASAGGTISVGRDQLTLAAAHLLLHQDRTQLGALPTDRPVAYQVNDLRASYALTLSRISLTPNVEATSYDYASTTIMGQPASQSYRNRVLIQGGVTASYEVAPSRNLLVVLRGLDSQYTQPQANQPSRDSTGWVALAGIDTKLDGLWRIRLLAGWEGREFASPQYGNHSAPVAEADVVFSATGLTTITGTLARTIEDAAQEGVAGYIDTSARLTVDHEYARNILLQGYGSVQHAAYLQGGGTQTGYGLGGSVTWLLNRHVRVSATEDFTAMRGAAPSQPGSGSFNRNVTLLTIGFGL